VAADNNQLELIVGAYFPFISWNWVLFALHITLAALAVTHAMLYKRDSRAALGWVSVCLFFPLFGPLLYYMFGINRIQTQAQKLVGRRSFRFKVGYERGDVKEHAGAEDMPVVGQQLAPFVRVSDNVTSYPLTAGNHIVALKNGEQAYPAMLAAINTARKRVLLVTYLFESDSVGKSFVAALIAAHQRGVEVRVIIDGVGEFYSWPRLSRKLRKAGIQVAHFLPPKIFPPSFTINLRNHRKLLLLDSSVGFTGGMNIGARHLLESNIKNPTVDLHFQLSGPVVSQLESVFIEDWRFITHENIQTLTVQDKEKGTVFCRSISDGPNEDLDKISLTMMGAISAAQDNVFIITPYFLPSREMISSLQSAALRGVDVAIILPQQSNLRFIDWATRNLLWELLQHGVKVYYQPPPFAHTKLFVVDGVYAQIGSANLDPRSLRLNFELNLEIYSAEFVEQLADYIRSIRQTSREITLKEVDERHLLVRLRDAACWLFMPYL